ncbi:ABC transporter ATP-binding protein [Nocardioides litoris]|uniref:ABC transporter ATP-binding protein n=1 Tax=Nocardioides litoris TaxID=1926648 RepID=UPI001476F29A|nr:ABC transporter ATP-binding protein/permease [Nocardioides litoris]
MAAVGSVVIALLDGIAVALVLPLVALTTGDGSTSEAVRVVAALTGQPSEGQLAVILTAAVVALFIIKDLGSLAFLWWSTGFVQSERVRASARIMTHMLEAPYADIARRSSAEMLRTADAAVLQVFSYTVNGLVQSFAAASSVALLLTALAVLAPVPTLVLVAYFTMASLLFSRLARPRAAAAGAQLAAASMEGYRTAFTAMGAAKELQLRGTQRDFVGRYEEAQLRGASAGRTATFITGLPRYLLEILFVIAIGVVALLGAREDSQGGPIGLLALFVAAGFRMLPSVSALLSNVTNIRVGIEPLALVHAELRNAVPPPESASHLGGLTPTARELTEGIAVQSVHFRYPGSERDVLIDVSLTIPHGSSLALVGGSGAGKTTLADVIIGLHHPTQGRVLADGRDVADDLAGWRAGIGYVAQDVFLLDGSLAANVAFQADPDEIDLDRVRRSVRLAQLDDVVAQLPDGLAAQVGERGLLLSGGQKQRIGIARALYRDCTLLVLDEATSALDNETEDRINETIRALHGTVSVLVIAHRLSTVRHADQIAYMAHGRIDGLGTFQDLQESHRGFARLVELGSLG